MTSAKVNKFIDITAPRIAPSNSTPSQSTPITCSKNSYKNSSTLSSSCWLPSISTAETSPTSSTDELHRTYLFMLYLYQSLQFLMVLFTIYALSYSTQSKKLLYKSSDLSCTIPFLLWIICIVQLTIFNLCDYGKQSNKPNTNLNRICLCFCGNLICYHIFMQFFVTLFQSLWLAVCYCLYGWHFLVPLFIMLTIWSFIVALVFYFTTFEILGYLAQRMFVFGAFLLTAIWMCQLDYRKHNWEPWSDMQLSMHIALCTIMYISCATLYLTNPSQRNKPIHFQMQNVLGGISLIQTFYAIRFRDWLYDFLDFWDED